MPSVVLAFVMMLVLAAPASAQQADTILVNGKVLVVDAAFSTHEALAIRECRIMAVGRSALGIGWTMQDAIDNTSGDGASRQGDVTRMPPVVTGRDLGVVIGAGTDAHRVSTYNPFTVLQWLLDGRNAGGTPLALPPRRPGALTHFASTPREAPGSPTTRTPTARSRWGSGPTW